MPLTFPTMVQYIVASFFTSISTKGWPLNPKTSCTFLSGYGFPIKDASTCVPFRVYGDGADASQHFELFTILPLLCCSRSTLDNRIVTAIRNTNKTTSECRRLILIVLAWSFEALCNLIQYYIIFSNR